MLLKQPRIFTTAFLNILVLVWMLTLFTLCTEFKLFYKNRVKIISPPNIQW